VYVIEASGSAVAEAVTTSPFDDRDPAWSPTGVKLAFSSNRSGTYDIWLVRLGKEPRRITSRSGNDFEPAWSPDGRRLAFTRRGASGNYDVYVLDLYTGKVNRITKNPAEDSEPAWSRDGEQIAFTSDREGDYDIYVINGAQVTIYQTPSAGTARSTALTLVVADLRGTMTELRSRGVVFEDYDLENGPKTVDGVSGDESSGMAAWFTDSEGNIVNLVQLPPGFPLP